MISATQVNKLPTDLSFMSQLLISPQETLEAEFKNWLSPAVDDNKAKIAKEILALANHGGGYLIFGYHDKSMTPDLSRPSDLSHYSPDSINAIVRKFADPSFHCEVHKIKHPVTGEEFPIVCVPGGHRVPVRCKSGSSDKTVEEGRYYTRLPGPESGMARSSKDWDDIIRRSLFNSKDELLDSIRSILNGNVDITSKTTEVAKELSLWSEDCEHAWIVRLEKLSGTAFDSYYPFGAWSISYKFVGNHDVNVDELVSAVEKIPGRRYYPSWDIVGNNVATLYFDTQNTVEWIRFRVNDWRSGWTAYCRAKNDLSFFLGAGYIEDIGKSDVHPNPGEAFYTTNAAEFLFRTIQHASHIARSFNLVEPQILMRIVWNNTDSRSLKSFEDYNSPVLNFVDTGIKSNWPSIDVSVGPISLNHLESNLVEAILPSVQTVLRAFNTRVEATSLRTYLSDLLAYLKQ
jgi:hypothetical protein